MEIDSRKLLGLLLVILIALGAMHMDVTRAIFGQLREMVSKGPATPEPAGTPAAGPGTAIVPSPSQPETPLVSNGRMQTQSAVTDYMSKLAGPQATLSFLNWSDFAANGQVSAITVRYRVARPSQPDVVASVRFTLQGGNVIGEQTIPERAAALAAAPVATPGLPATPLVSDSRMQAQSAVADYMSKLAGPQATLSFLKWSDFAVNGQAAAITVRYRVRKPPEPDAVVSARFTLEGAKVIRAQIIPEPLPPVVVDRFSEPIRVAQHGGSRRLTLYDAFSLDQLEQAKAAAAAQWKPLGFVMVWGKLFGQEWSPREKGSESALVHFYDVFHQNLVLVFVLHESELGKVPPAVQKGFNGPDEGGFAPNMAVTDASATEFITEVPFRDLDAAGRDDLFAAGGKTIDEWMATHPDAMPTPAADDGGQ